MRIGAYCKVPPNARLRPDQEEARWRGARSGGAALPRARGRERNRRRRAARRLPHGGLLPRAGRRSRAACLPRGDAALRARRGSFRHFRTEGRQALDRWRGRQDLAAAGAARGCLRSARSDGERARSRTHRRHARQAGEHPGFSRRPAALALRRAGRDGRRVPHRPDGRDRPRRPQAVCAARRHRDGGIDPAHRLEHPQQEARGGHRRARPRREGGTGRLHEDRGRGPGAGANHGAALPCHGPRLHGAPHGDGRAPRRGGRERRGGDGVGRDPARRGTRGRARADAAARSGNAPRGWSGADGGRSAREADRRPRGWTRPAEVRRDRRGAGGRPALRHRSVAVAPAAAASRDSREALRVPSLARRGRSGPRGRGAWGRPRAQGGPGGPRGGPALAPAPGRRGARGRDARGAAPRLRRGLALGASPSLRQHAHTPVDWRPGGDDAFGEARAKDRAVSLSVGYPTCHWCHVMEEESFEDLEIAELLNQLYVPIKVDREERPDVDSIYMQAVQLLTQHGGWPMSVFLAPDRKPFYGGTYFPPRDGMRGARIGFASLLKELHRVYSQERERAVEAGDQIAQAIRGNLSAAAPTSLPGVHVLNGAAESYGELFDPEEGGVKRAPKFPSSLGNRFLLRYWKRTGAEEARNMATLSLTRMARGGS